MAEVQVYVPVAIWIDVDTHQLGGIEVGEWDGAPWLDMRRPNVWAPIELAKDYDPVDPAPDGEYAWIRNNEWEAQAESALRTLLEDRDIYPLEADRDVYP